MKDEEILEVMAESEHNHIQLEMRRLGREAHPDWEAMPEDYKVGARKAASFVLAALRAHGLEVVSVEPTPQMCQAYYDLCRKEETLAVAASDIWRAMLSATKGE